MFTVSEVARRLRLCDDTVYRMVARGQIPAVRVRGRIRIDAGELDAWVFGPAVTERSNDE